MSIFNILRIVIDKAEEAVNEIKEINLHERKVFHVDVENTPKEKVNDFIDKFRKPNDTAEYSDLKNRLIKFFYMLPELLKNYNISQEDIDEVLIDIDEKFLSYEMDSAKMSIIFNNILEEYSNTVLIDMGVIDIDGHMKINPIDFCYATTTPSTPSNSHLTNQEKEIKFMKDTLAVIGDGKDVSKEILQKQDENKLLEFEKEIYAITQQDTISDSNSKRLQCLYTKVLQHLIMYNKIKSMDEVINHAYYTELNQIEKINIERYFLKNIGED